MSEPYIPGPNPTVMDYLVFVWEHHRDAFDALLMQPIPPLVTETKIVGGEPEEWWVNSETVSNAIERQRGRHLLACGFLSPLARDVEAVKVLFEDAQTIVPLEPALAKRMHDRQRMLSAFEMRYLCGLMWKTEYSVEWPVWRINTVYDLVYEGDFGRYEPFPKWLLKIYSEVDCGCMVEISAENALREKLIAALKASTVDDGEKVSIVQSVALELGYAEGWKDGFSEKYLAGVEAGREAGAIYKGGS